MRFASNIFTILPGETKNASDFGTDYCFAEVYTDTPVASFSARTSGNTCDNTMDRSVLGVFEATDAKCLIASTGLVFGPFAITVHY